MLEFISFYHKQKEAREIERGLERRTRGGDLKGDSKRIQAKS